MDPCFTERSAHLSRMASHSVRVDMSLLRRIQNSICLITAGKVARNKGTLGQHPACVICALSDSAADPYFTIFHDRAAVRSFFPAVVRAVCRRSHRWNLCGTRRARGHPADRHQWHPIPAMGQASHPAEDRWCASGDRKRYAKLVLCSASGSSWKRFAPNDVLMNDSGRRQRIAFE